MALGVCGHPGSNGRSFARSTGPAPLCSERYVDAFGPLVSAAEHEHTRSAYRAAQRWLVKAAQCLRHARIPKDDLRWGEVYARWSICARVMGDFAPALRHAYRLNTLADTHDRHDMRARALLEIARGTDTTEGADTATPMYHAAVEAARRSGGIEILINCLTGLARAHRNSSNFELARTLYEEATSYCDPEAHPLLYGTALLGLARLDVLYKRMIKQPCAPWMHMTDLRMPALDGRWPRA